MLVAARQYDANCESGEGQRFHWSILVLRSEYPWVEQDEGGGGRRGDDQRDPRDTPDQIQSPEWMMRRRLRSDLTRIFRAVSLSGVLHGTSGPIFIFYISMLDYA